jgi:hypothetical protein
VTVGPLPLHCITLNTILRSTHYELLHPSGIRIRLRRVTGSRILGSAYSFPMARSCHTNIRDPHISRYKSIESPYLTTRAPVHQLHISTMKLFTVYSSLLLASLSAIGLAEISFDPLPLRLYTGDSCELHWSTDTDYVSTPQVLVLHTGTDCDGRRY